MQVKLATILRLLMGLILIIVIATSLIYYTWMTWWVFVVLLLLVANVETTAFKHGKNDKKRRRHIKYDDRTHSCYLCHFSNCTFINDASYLTSL